MPRVMYPIVTYRSTVQPLYTRISNRFNSCLAKGARGHSPEFASVMRGIRSTMLAIAGFGWQMLWTKPPVNRVKWQIAPSEKERPNLLVNLA